MSVEAIAESHPKAKKNYPCDASKALFESLVYPDDFTNEEVEILADAYNNSTIKKGDIYLKQRNKLDGRIYTFRARPEVIDIYFKYECNEL